MMVIDNKYELGQTVYLVTDEDQLPRMVTCINIFPGGMICYELSCGAHASEHYDVEMSEEKNLVNAI